MTHHYSKPWVLLLASTVVLYSVAASQDQPRAVGSREVHGNAVYSAGVDAGDYVYISGQGPRKSDGNLPSTFDAQVKQALDNVNAIVSSAGVSKSWAEDESRILR